MILLFSTKNIMIMTKEMKAMNYSISDVSKMTNLPISTLRYYDKEGLLPYIERKASGYRVFKDDDIRMLEIIECFKNTGMSIKEIKHFIELVKQGNSSLQERYNLFLERKKTVEKQMEDLQKQLDLINYKCEYYYAALQNDDKNETHNHL